jgi:hypothetical protein
MAANSKSLFVIDPVGFLADTKLCRICDGKGSLKMMGLPAWVVGVGNQAPPIPAPLASTAPRKDGA